MSCVHKILTPAFKNFAAKASVYDHFADNSRLRMNVKSCKNKKEINWSVTETMHLYTEAATRGVLCKKVFSEISQNSQENSCARVSF